MFFFVVVLVVRWYRRPLTRPSLEAVERLELKFCTVPCILIKILNPVIPGPQAPFRCPEECSSSAFYDDDGGGIVAWTGWCNWKNFFVQVNLKK